MALLICDGGQNKLLNLLTGAWTSKLFMGLFIADITPASSDTAALYNTNEATFDGYTRKALSGWTYAVLASGKAITLADILTWTVATTGGADVVYGYFVVDNVGDLIFAEKSDYGPRSMDTAGQSLSVFPRFSLQTL